MVSIIKKLLVFFVVIWALSACSSTDLAGGNEVLTPDQKIIVTTISKMVPEKCIRGAIDANTGKVKQATAMKVRNAANIKRFYTSNNGWYKAEAISDAGWDNFFYNPTSGAFVCGQREWDTYADTGSVQFQEAGKEPRKLLSTSQGSAVSPEAVNSFISGGIQGCMGNTKLQEYLVKLKKESQLNKYCSCVMGKLATFVTNDDLAKFERTNSMDVIRPLMNVSEQYCSKSLALY
jgi:hypothetical protein